MDVDCPKSCSCLDGMWGQTWNGTVVPLVPKVWAYRGYTGVLRNQSQVEVLPRFLYLGPGLRSPGLLNDDEAHAQ